MPQPDTGGQGGCYPGVSGWGELMEADRITLAEYAALIWRDRSRVLRKVLNGDFPSARRKIIHGYTVWMIDRYEPWTDKHR